MAIYKIHKNSNYTTISNYHLKDNNLSLKAKGLLSLMLSLPENWDYSARGLEKICKETKDTVNNILNELENNNYLERKRVYCDGKISDWEYNIFETKDLHPKNQDLENQDLGFYDINKYTKELNTNKEKNNINTHNIKNNNIYNIIQKEKTFNKPTIEEIQQYCNERNNEIDAEYFYDHYQSNGWLVGKTKMKDWKAAIRTWERNKNGGKNNSKKETVKYEMLN